MFRKFFRRIKDESGNSLVSSIIIFPIMIMLLITTVDFSMYLANRAQIQGVARDGARTVAIMGGNGTSSQGTPIERQYGQSRSEACNGLGQIPAYHSGSTAIECNMIHSLEGNSGLVNVSIVGVTCSPQRANFIGQRVSCEVRWQYGGMPFSAFSLIQSGTSYDSEGLRGVNITAGSSESEVDLNNVSLVNR